MEGLAVRKFSGRRRSGRRVHTPHQKPLLPERRCLTDTEDPPDNISYKRYSQTVFPLFTNHSDDEVIIEKARQKYLPRLKFSASAPTGRVFKQAQDAEEMHIQDLPADCKIKIFTYLSSVDKGKCMRVCREWHHILLTSKSLWTRVKLWDFPLTCLPSSDHNVPSCYDCYKSRVFLFSLFLADVKPKLQKLEFKFDIGEGSHEFLKLFEDIMSRIDIRELKYLELNWKDTPVRPFWMEKKWFNTNCATIVSHQRLRGRHFTEHFDCLTRIATKIETLVLPFDWNRRSVKCLSRLKNLHTLVIEKYFVFKTVEQDLLDKFLNGLPKLQRLMLEIWTPSGPNMLLYRLSSNSLQHLDISQCRGFYLSSVYLPRLERIRISRPAWNGPLVFREQIKFPCLYNMLVTGAPNLTKVNDHYLEEGWKTHCYPTLHEALKSICSCQRHKTGWAM